MFRNNFSLDALTGRMKTAPFMSPGNWYQSCQPFILCHMVTEDATTYAYPTALEGTGQTIHAFLFAQDIPILSWIQEDYVGSATLHDDHPVTPDTCELVRPMHFYSGRNVSAKTNHPYVVSAKTNYGPGEAFKGTSLTNGVNVCGFMHDWVTLDRSYVDAEDDPMYAMIYGWFAAHSPIIAGETYYGEGTGLNFPILINESGYTQAMYEAGNRCDFMFVPNAGYIVGLVQNDLDIYLEQV